MKLLLNSLYENLRLRFKFRYNMKPLQNLHFCLNMEQKIGMILITIRKFNYNAFHFELLNIALEHIKREDQKDSTVVIDL